MTFSVPVSVPLIEEVRKEGVQLTAQEADDLDSCIADSLTLNELHPDHELYAVLYDEEMLAYLDRIRILRVKLAEIADPIPAPTGKSE